MPIEVSWVDSEQTTIYWGFEGRWSWSEFDRAWVKTGEWIEATPHPVDFILDLRASMLMPPNIMNRLRQPSYQRLVNFQGQHLNVLICDDSFLRLLLSTFARVFAPGLLIAFASTQHEAQVIIQHHRQKPRVRQ